jgi:hypothetical protein
MSTGATLHSKHGGRKIQQLMEFTGRSAVKVGVLRGTGEHPNANGGQTIALIAAWNEFGTHNKDDSERIPSRPFMRSTLIEHDYYRGDLKTALREALLSLGDPDVMLKRVGIKAASDIRNKIRNNDFERNKESTKKRKGGKDKPLIDSAVTLQSIQSELE